MAPEEYHIASFVLRVKPEGSGAAADAIKTLPGIELHAEQDGKLIVTAEANSERELADAAMRLEQVPQVLSVAPVYHEYADASDSERPYSAESE